MKRCQLLVLLAVVAFAGCSFKKEPGAGAREPQNADGMRRSIAPPSEEQRRQMTDCLSRKGQKMPERPNFTAEQRAAMVKCKDESAQRGMEAFQACVKKAGVQLPPPPSPELRKAVMECRQEIFAPPR
jgi:hypothetical protein